MDGQTVFTDTTNYAASAVATGTNKEMSEIKSTMKKLVASVNAQTEKVETLSTNMNRGIISSVKIIDKKKARTCLHVCTHCKSSFYHKDGNFLELEVNKAKQYHR